MPSHHMYQPPLRSWWRHPTSKETTYWYIKSKWQHIPKGSDPGHLLPKQWQLNPGQPSDHCSNPNWGWPPTVSAKLAAKNPARGIHQKVWTPPGQVHRGWKLVSHVRAKKRVWDLNVWLESLALYVGVVAPRSRELMAYIVKSTKTLYGRHMTRHTVATGHTKWIQINSSLLHSVLHKEGKKKWLVWA